MSEIGREVAEILDQEAAPGNFRPDLRPDPRRERRLLDRPESKDGDTGRLFQQTVVPGVGRTTRRVGIGARRAASDVNRFGQRTGRTIGRTATHQFTRASRTIGLATRRATRTVDRTTARTKRTVRRTSAQARRTVTRTTTRARSTTRKATRSARRFIKKGCLLRLDERGVVVGVEDREDVPRDFVPWHNVSYLTDGAKLAGAQGAG